MQVEAWWQQGMSESLLCQIGFCLSGEDGVLLFFDYSIENAVK